MDLRTPALESSDDSDDSDGDVDDVAMDVTPVKTQDLATDPCSEKEGQSRSAGCGKLDGSATETPESCAVCDWGMDLLPWQHMRQMYLLRKLLNGSTPFSSSEFQIRKLQSSFGWSNDLRECSSSDIFLEDDSIAGYRSWTSCIVDDEHVPHSLAIEGCISASLDDVSALTCKSPTRAVHRRAVVQASDPRSSNQEHLDMQCFLCVGGCNDE
mmetsp:Transcript_19424/g.53988  ORF Transcript_19424/g.53988 Transcript_19424/m.53988 type:complete len:212 (+) Transcript_19424:1055-1690(+)